LSPTHTYGEIRSPFHPTLPKRAFSPGTRELFLSLFFDCLSFFPMPLHASVPTQRTASFPFPVPPMTKSSPSFYLSGFVPLPPSVPARLPTRPPPTVSSSLPQVGFLHFFPRNGNLLFSPVAQVAPPRSFLHWDQLDFPYPAEAFFALHFTHSPPLPF